MASEDEGEDGDDRLRLVEDAAAAVAAAVAVWVVLERACFVEMLEEGYLHGSDIEGCAVPP